MNGVCLELRHASKNPRFCFVCASFVYIIGIVPVALHITLRLVVIGVERWRKRWTFGSYGRVDRACTVGKGSMGLSFVGLGGLLGFGRIFLFSNI